MDVRPISNSTQTSPAFADRTAVVAQRPAATVPVELVHAVREPRAVPSSEELKQAVQDANQAMQNLASDLEFSIDEDSERTVVKVVDRATGEVIRQIPSEEMLEIAKALDQAQGLLLSQTA